MERKKSVFSLETPYSTAPWPDLSLETQETILELLCSFVSPVGEYRRRFISPSKGKRDKKRKRKRADGDNEIKPDTPPPPQLSSFLDVGLASISRTLDKLSCEEDTIKLSPGSNGKGLCGDLERFDNAAASPQIRRYAAIFVEAGQSSSLTWHFPQMVSMASLSHYPTKPPIRLVGFDRDIVGNRLGEALGIPRASCIALYEGCPESEALLEIIHEHVPPVHVPWLQDAKVGAFKATKIKSTETSVGPRKGPRVVLPICPSK